MTAAIASGTLLIYSIPSWIFTNKPAPDHHFFSMKVVVPMVIVFATSGPWPENSQLDDRVLSENSVHDDGSNGNQGDPYVTCFLFKGGPDQCYM